MSHNAVTDTDRDGVALTPDALSIRQQHAARLLGIGHSQQQAAEAVHVHIRTIQRWCDLPEFDALVKQLRQVSWQRVEPSCRVPLARA